jgi:hypothetical protein
MFLRFTVWFIKISAKAIENDNGIDTIKDAISPGDCLDTENKFTA